MSNLSIILRNLFQEQYWYTTQLVLLCQHASIGINISCWGINTEYHCQHTSLLAGIDMNQSCKKLILTVCQLKYNIINFPPTISFVEIKVKFQKTKTENHYVHSSHASNSSMILGIADWEHDLYVHNSSGPDPIIKYFDCNTICNRLLLVFCEHQIQFLVLSLSNWFQRYRPWAVPQNLSFWWLHLMILESWLCTTCLEILFSINQSWLTHDT
jgi:hypothetical protein